MKIKLLCVSLNPAIDRRIGVSGLRVGAVNRARGVEPAAGGKAAHVAFAATALGAEVRWLSFLGGAEGESCREGIEARGIAPVVVAIDERTRTNLEIIDEATGEVTEILEPGPLIRDVERAALLREFEREARERPSVVLSGSLPEGIASSFYAELVKAAKDAGCRVFLDTSGEALAEALEAAPDVIKPNRQEIGALLGREIRSIPDAVAAARELRQRGPRTVIVSLGAEGAVVVDEHAALHGMAPSVKAISTVGSGDSFFAGWVFGVAQGWATDECLRLAIACGTANCEANSPGIISPEAVKRHSVAVKIERFSI
jgi:1-phosphofructokinase family hexose kinase